MKRKAKKKPEAFEDAFPDIGEKVGNFTVMAPRGGKAVPPVPAAPTAAHVCHSAEGFSVRWSLQDPNIVTAATACAGGVCSHCHDPVWEADAAEFYFTFDMADARQNVTEIDISAAPGGLWGGWINNTFGYDGSSPNILIDCGAAAQVAHTRVAGGWGANVTIPWSVYTHGRASRPSAGRVNFYRWDRGLQGGGANLSAWSVTQCDGQARCNPPHVPKYFGVARLLDPTT